MLLDDHPHGTTGPDGLLLNWNNQSAPGFMHGDGEGTGSYHRLLLFDQWPDATRLTDVVGVMNRAATEDVRSPVWPIVSDLNRLRSADNRQGNWPPLPITPERVMATMRAR